MKLMLLGAHGQVGWELSRALAPVGEVVSCDRKTADLGNLHTLRQTVQNYSPDIIVNAAAYTAVDKAESEPELASKINAEAVGILAEEAARTNTLLIHYSTDYVYDGAKNGAYLETDVTNPISVYGKTKLQGEELIRMSQCRHIIFRTSWVYAARGHNFVKTMLRLFNERNELKVVADQVGTPTSAELIADITALVLYRILQNKQQAEQLMGTYHLTASGETNWHQYAGYILNKAIEAGVDLKIRPGSIIPIKTSEYPTPAKRPLNSRLNCKKLETTFGILLPKWEYHVSRTLDEIK